MMIAEAASEKPRRGRPIVLPRERETSDGVCLSYQSDRHKRERTYAFVVYTTLAGHPDCRWLVATRKEAMAGTASSRFGILAELGRYATWIGWPDPEAIELTTRLAMEICEAKPKTKDAIALIRRRRLGEKPGDAMSLAVVLAKTVDAYVIQHPETTKQQIVCAMRTVAQTIEATEP